MCLDTNLDVSPRWSGGELLLRRLSATHDLLGPHLADHRRGLKYGEGAFLGGILNHIELLDRVFT